MTDGVFSMDGDVAPLHALCAVAREHDAWLMVDDAHGLGVLGPDGGGSVAEAGLGIDEVPVLMGALGKAFGCFGAFVAGSEVLIETLIQLARTYVYTTASPPAVAAAGLEALKLVRQEAWRREKLAELTAAFRDGCKEAGVELMPSHSPIQPVVVGDSREAVRHSELLADAGYLLQAIRPPTVPRHTARLRVTLSAAEPDSLGQVGIRVEQPGRPSAVLYLDDQDRLTHVRLRVPSESTGNPEWQDVWLGGTIEAAGVRWPRELHLLVNGKPYFDLTIESLRVLPRLVDPLLKRPP
jgi:hypothetical protein